MCILSLPQVILCDSPKDIEEWVDMGQLTSDVGGELDFDAHEWTEHRSVRKSLLRSILHSLDMWQLFFFFFFFCYLIDSGFLLTAKHSLQNF